MELDIFNILKLFISSNSFKAYLNCAFSTKMFIPESSKDNPRVFLEKAFKLERIISKIKRRRLAYTEIDAIKRRDAASWANIEHNACSSCNDTREYFCQQNKRIPIVEMSNNNLINKSKS